MSAMSANFAVAPSHVRPAAALRRGTRGNSLRVVRRDIVAEAIKAPAKLNTTKSDAVRF